MCWLGERKRRVRDICSERVNEGSTSKRLRCTARSSGIIEVTTDQLSCTLSHSLNQNILFFKKIEIRHPSGPEVQLCWHVLSRSLPHPLLGGKGVTKSFEGECRGKKKQQLRLFRTEKLIENGLQVFTLARNLLPTFNRWQQLRLW